MKRKITTISFILLMLITASCNKNETAIRETAEGFLNAYLKADFDSAATFCTQELINEKIDSLKIPIQELDSVSKEILFKKLDSIKSEVVSIEKLHKKDSIKVTYKVIQGNQLKDLTNTMIVVKSGEFWKIGKLE